MILGIVLAVLVLLSCFMCIAKKFKNKSFQIWNHRIHRITGFLILALVFLHLILAWSLRKQRPAMMYVLGITMAVMVVILIASFYLRNGIGKKWITIHKAAACVVVICLIGHVFFGISSLMTYKAQISALTIDEINLSNVSDGEYVGEENVGYIYCKVKVTVDNGTLESVEILEHRTERGKPAEIVAEIITEEQSNKVEAVSGATNSSKVIMKAVENALQCGIK